MNDPFEFNPTIEIPQCQIHGQLAIFVNPDMDEKQKPVLCIECFSEYKKIDDQVKENTGIISNLFNEDSKRKDALITFQTDLKNFQNKITQSIQKIIELIQNQVSEMQQQIEQQKNIFKESPITSVNSILDENKNNIEKHKKFCKKIFEQLQNLKSNYNSDSLMKDWSLNIQKQNNLIQEKTFEYQQISKPVQQSEICWALAVNSIKSTVIAGCNSKIKVFEFQNQLLKQIQLLDNHSEAIQCLKFMKKSNQFISGCIAGKITLWKYANKQWLQEQTLVEHYDRISCLQFHYDEKSFITGSNDKTIKFWNYNKNSWSCIQTQYFQNEVHDISLNNSNSKLIVHIFYCEELYVLEKIQSKWTIKQTIKLSAYCIRVQFIDDDQFAIQFMAKNQMQIFNFSIQYNQFQEDQIITVKCGEDEYNLFPMQYIYSKSILIGKNCQYINIIQKRNGQFILSQAIDFGCRSLYGCVSEDGEFLFTWDKISQEIQIRKLKEKE